MNWVDVVVEGIISIVGSVLNPFLNVILFALNAAEVAFGQSVIIDELRSATNDFKDAFNQSVSDLMRQGVTAGLQMAADAADFPIDASDPFSAASLTAAVNHKLGTEIGDVTDQESVKAYLLDRAAQEVNDALGIDAFSDGESLQSPEAWASAVAALIADSIQGSGFIGEHVCAPVEVVLGAFCKTPNCNFCMGEAGELECIAKREKARRNRDKYKKKCSRSAR